GVPYTPPLMLSWGRAYAYDAIHGHGRTVGGGHAAAILMRDQQARGRKCEVARRTPAGRDPRCAQHSALAVQIDAAQAVMAAVADPQRAVVQADGGRSAPA